MQKASRLRNVALWQGAPTVLMLAASASASASSKTWQGELDRNTQTKLSFRVGKSHITRFTIPEIGCASLTGFRVETLYIPSIRIRHGKFSIKYHVPGAQKTVKVAVKGRLKGKRASGSVRGNGFCGTSIDDTNLTGGVGITISGSDNSRAASLLEPGNSNLKLRLSSGAKFDCSDSFDQQDLTRGGCLRADLGLHCSYKSAEPSASGALLRPGERRDSQDRTTVVLH